MSYIPDLIQKRILKLAVSRLANHPAVLDRLRTEFAEMSRATLRMTGSMSSLEWPHSAKSDLEFQQVDKRLLRQLDHWISCQPEFGTPVQPMPLPPAGAPAAAPSTEPAEQRQARRYQACIDAGLKFTPDGYGHNLRGITKLSKAENITRQAYTDDVLAYLAKR